MTVFKFSLLCHLLNELEQNRSKNKSAVSRVADSDIQTVRTWFNVHDRLIPRHGPQAVAFLSCLFPERRPDRVFNIQERRLEPIIKRALGLGTARLKELQHWRSQNGTDFASCVERVMSTTDSEPKPSPGVTLDEIETALDRIAATSSFSSADLRARIDGKTVDIALELSRIFGRLHSSEAKLMVRMLLKTYSPVQIPETIAMQCFHFLLPDLLGFQNSIQAAVKLLDGSMIKRTPPRVAKDVEGRCENMR